MSKGCNNDLCFENIYFSYSDNHNQKKICQNLNLNIKNGIFTSIIGPSGSGKTSLLKMIAGLIGYQKGQITFENKKINKIFRKITLVQQNVALMPWLNVYQNIVLAKKSYRTNFETEAIRVIKDVGLESSTNLFPYQLSGGMLQRVAIARAIAMKPELILADEPTGNLDTENSVMISDILFKYVKEEGSSLIMVTHDPKLANKAKRKIRIKDGKIK